MGLRYDEEFDTWYLDPDEDPGQSTGGGGAPATDPAEDPAEDPGQSTGGGGAPATDSTPVNIGSADWLKAIKDLLSGTSSSGVAGQLLGLGGIGSLINKMMGGSGSTGFAGYSGGIPSYTGTRTQTPIAEQRPTAMVDGKPVPYRPGQGGITYFTPMQYSPTPAAATTTTTTNPATTTTATPGNAAGGLLGLAGGGRFLRGPGDGVSDSIPATIGQKQPARLADGEFVIDARTVSELGNGSSEAGARKLYQMMERVHAARKKAKRGEPSGADKNLPK